MATNHKTITFIGGDDWLFNVKLLDADGDPIDLDTLTAIKFLFHTPFGEQMPWLATLITRLDPASAGIIKIWIPAAETTKFESGVYADWLRINCNGIISTLLTGPVSVIADPWKAPIALQPQQRIARAFSGNDNVIVLLNNRERIERVPANDDEVVEWVAPLAAKSEESLPMPPVAPTLWARLRRSGEGSGSLRGSSTGAMFLRSERLTSLRERRTAHGGQGDNDRVGAK